MPFGPQPPETPWISPGLQYIGTNTFFTLPHNGDALISLYSQSKFNEQPLK